MTSDHTLAETFEVQSGRLNISDPLYFGERMESAAYDLPARNGRWCVDTSVGEYGEWGPRIAALTCRHESVPAGDPIVETISRDIGVDAATVCIYDATDGIEDAHELEPPVVIGPRGACSDSGIGDGSYAAYGRFEAGELVAVRVVYIPDAQGRFPEDRFPP